MTDEIIKDAYISDCEKYRYTLIREWDVHAPTMLFVMLNPSTADAVEDDPTIRRCINFAKREGCGAIEVVNLFAWRATDPKELKIPSDPVGPNNDAVIVEAAEDAKIVVCAWGTKGVLKARDKTVLKLLKDNGLSLKCLGKTKDGHPKHPLYLADETPLIDL